MFAVKTVNLQNAELLETVQVFQALDLVVLQVEMGEVGRKLQVLDRLEMVIIQVDDRQVLACRYQILDHKNRPEL